MSSSPLTLPPPSLAETDPGAALFLALKKTYSMASGIEVERLDRRFPDGAEAEHLVQGLIAPRSVNILVGDSGIGKSPLAYQIGLAVAGGVPFLDMPVKPAKVLFMDYENHLPEVHWMATQQRKHLGLALVPDTFLFWPVSHDPRQEEVETVIRKLAPDLVIIDSLRAFHPEMESDSVKAMECLRNLRVIAERHGTAFLLIHHLRKQRLLETPELEDGHPLDWLRRAAGVRALINQTDVRLALARRATEKPASESGPDLILSGHFRTRGQVGPFLIRRVWDSEGEPSGYERFEPKPSLLANAEHEAAFAALPDSFSFGVAEQTLGKPGESANFFLHKLVRLGLAQKMSRGKYRKSAWCSRERLAIQ